MTDPVTRGADPQTSIGAAIRGLVDGAADAVVSAGSSGAIVAAAVMGLRRLHGVRRPALTAILPGAHGPTVLLDVGAGMQTSPFELVQHAVLGAAYARLVAGVPQPRVGLLSVGHEPGKGDKLRRAADAALRLHPLAGGGYIGLVEGHDVVLGVRADVIVTDGFTGNIALKISESVVDMIESLAGAELGAAARRRLDASEHGGALLAGVRGVVIVGHGRSSARAIERAIELAHRFSSDRLVDRLERGIAAIPVSAT